MIEIAVLIPCYNESKTIQKVVRDFREALPEATIFVYDNNSTDGTDSLAREAGAVVRYERSQGKGNAIRSMFRDIDAKCYVIADGDDTYPAESARAMARMILEQGVDMVIGDRLSSTYFVENKRRFHNTGNIAVRKMVNTLFGGAIQDIMTGYRAFSFQFVKSFPVLSGGFEIETEMSIHALDKNIHVASLPVDYRDRTAGSVSKLNTISDGVSVVKTIFSLFKNYKPLLFFGSIACLLAIISLVLIIPVFVEYFHTGLVPRFPTLIGGGFILMASILFFMDGLSLENDCKRQKQNFEIEVNQIALLGRLLEYRQDENAQKENNV